VSRVPRWATNADSMGETLSVQGSTTAGRVGRRRRAKTTTQTRWLRLLAAAVVGVAVFALGVGVGFAGSAGRLPDGVTIAGVDVSGMTPTAAKALLAGRAETQANVPVTFVAGSQVWRIKPSDLGVEEDWDAAVDEAMAKGGGSTLLRGFRRIGLR